MKNVAKDTAIAGVSSYAISAVGTTVGNAGSAVGGAVIGAGTVAVGAIGAAVTGVGFKICKKYLVGGKGCKEGM